MGKKREEGQETYEVWIYKNSGDWAQIVEGGNQGIFKHKPRALLLAQEKSLEEGIVEALVIERRPIVSFNGPAISVKGRLAKTDSLMVDESKKKEESHAADGVHGNRA